MAIGNMLAANEARYVAVQDETQVWRILDTWHDDIKTMDPDSDIPDESPAVSVLTDGQVVALIKEAGRLGILQNATFGTGEAALEATILDKDQEILDLKEELVKLQEDNSKIINETTHSESYVLKEKAMVSESELKQKAIENILKLVSIQDLSNLGKE